MEKKKLTRKTQETLQASLDHMMEGCQIIDRDWRYLYVNEAAAVQGRKTKEELLGHRIMDVYPGIDKTEMFSKLKECMINRLHIQMDNEFTYPDGGKAWFNLHMEPVPEGVLILSVDITKNKVIEAELVGYRHRLEQVIADRTAQCAETNEVLTRKIQEARKTEEALKLRATILDSAKEAILLVNIKGDFVYANAAAMEAYGYSLDEFLNMNIRLLFPPEDAPSSESLLRHIIDKGHASLEMVHQQKSGGRMPVKAYFSMVKTAHGQFIAIVIRRLFSR